MTEAEKKIYDEFEAGGRALLEKAKADAAAIDADLNSIIGPTEAAVVKDVKAIETWFEGTWFWRAVCASWRWLLHWLDFLDDPRNGKFSHKRLIALALTFNALYIFDRMMVSPPTTPFGVIFGTVVTGGQVLAAVILAIVSAVTKT